MTVDEESDLTIIRKLVSSLGFENTWLNYTNFIIDNNLTNKKIIRNEGYKYH